MAFAVSHRVQCHTSRCALYALIACALLWACSSERAPASPSPATTTPPQSPFSGVWTGEYRITKSTGSRQSTFEIGTMRHFAVRLAQSGEAFIGALEFVEAETWVDISGMAEKDGTLVLAGTQGMVSNNDDTGKIEVTRFAIQVTRDGVGLTGVLEYTVRYSAAYQSLVLSRATEIVQANRTAPTPLITTFAGHWLGQWIVRSCSTPGSLFCYPYEPGYTLHFELILAQSGTSVTGTLVLPRDQVPVTGAAVGSTLTLAGSLQAASNGRNVRLVDWSSTADKVGRMTGAFSFVEDLVQPTLSSNYSAELLTAALVP
jgi:phage protein U